MINKSYKHVSRYFRLARYDNFRQLQRSKTKFNIWELTWSIEVNQVDDDSVHINEVLSVVSKRHVFSKLFVK